MREKREERGQEFVFASCELDTSPTPPPAPLHRGLEQADSLQLYNNETGSELLSESPQAAAGAVLPAAARLRVWRRCLCICAFRSTLFRRTAKIWDPGGPHHIPAKNDGEMNQEPLAGKTGKQSSSGGQGWGGGAGRRVAELPKYETAIMSLC